MDATLTAPAPLPAPALDTYEIPIEDLSPVDLIHEMERAHQQDEDGTRFYQAATRAIAVIKLLTGEAGGPDTDPPHVTTRPLFAIQQLGSITREWTLAELMEGGWQVLTRTRCTGRMGPWSKRGGPIQARDREAALRLCGVLYGERIRIQWTATQDGEWAAAGYEASRREVAV